MILRQLRGASAKQAITGKERGSIGQSSGMISVL